MIIFSMTRWELIQAFNKLAKILFISTDLDSDEILLKVKALVIDVLTENTNDVPLKFGASEDTKGA